VHNHPPQKPFDNDPHQEKRIMHTRRFIIIAATALSTIGCGMSAPTAPSPSESGGTSLFDSVASSAPGTFSTAAVSCTVDIGATTRPLPALHILANWINASLSQSSLACGQVRSLAAKLQQEVAALDQQSQNFAAACGISTALLAELQALTSTGKLAALTFPAPVPGAPRTVLGLATETNEHFCEAAHE
jgi:hypothetical protein